MYAFSLECDQPHQRRHWLRKAALEGHVESMYAIALEFHQSAAGKAKVARGWRRKRATSSPCTT